MNPMHNNVEMLSETSARALLASALKKMAPTPGAAVEIADRAGSDMRRHVFRARAGKPINAGAFLALCGAVGIDPADGSTRMSRIVPSHVAWPMVGMGLRIARQLRHHDQRTAAQLIGTSASTVCRIEAGDTVSVESFLAACRYIGAHPEHYAVEQVSRETGTETRNRCGRRHRGRGLDNAADSTTWNRLYRKQSSGGRAPEGTGVRTG